jgi:hypothetical protein
MSQLNLRTALLLAPAVPLANDNIFYQGFGTDGEIAFGNRT